MLLPPIKAAARGTPPSFLGCQVRSLGLDGLRKLTAGQLPPKASKKFALFKSCAADLDAVGDLYETGMARGHGSSAFNLAAMHELGMLVRTLQLESSTSTWPSCTNSDFWYVNFNLILRLQLGRHAQTRNSGTFTST